MDEIYDVMRKLSPTIGNELKIDSSNINKFPDIKKVLTNHSRGSAYMRQFFKLPLASPCDCVACQKSLFSNLVMPEEAYHEIPLLPLPIPQDSHGELHYMTLEEAIAQPFTDKHQPSLAKRQEARKNL